MIFDGVFFMFTTGISYCFVLIVAIDQTVAIKRNNYVGISLANMTHENLNQMLFPVRPYRKPSIQQQQQQQQVSKRPMYWKNWKIQSENGPTQYYKYLQQDKYMQRKRLQKLAQWRKNIKPRVDLSFTTTPTPATTTKEISSTFATSVMPSFNQTLLSTASGKMDPFKCCWCGCKFSWCCCSCCCSEAKNKKFNKG